ncbi:hypothetical protein C8Q70DRAFT_361513 [Cubamyces menziesii]|nr:hypothetical protein C8Q70DRAFT_361513 [Cubamyces menziesii]
MDVPLPYSRHYDSPPQHSYPVMADSLHYTTTPTHHYVPNAYYTSQMHPNTAHMHVVAAAPALRQDTGAQRKRPKYTRSKTGCLTCRGKKIKCDETKPKCMRCTHGQRECTWPEGVPTRKKPTSKREPPSPIDGMEESRPSTAGSSGMSEAATPPTRGPSPPKREPIEMGIPPMVSRRHSDPNVNMPVVINDGRRAVYVL